MSIEKQNKLPKRTKKQLPEGGSTARNPLYAEIEEEVGTLLPAEKRDEVVSKLAAIFVHHEEKFSGPIAHPRHLREYEDIHPGAADRIISMAERQQSHIIEQQQQATSREFSDRRLGMWMGAAAFFLLVVLAYLLGVNGQPWLASAFVASSAIGVVKFFVDGRNPKD